MLERFFTKEDVPNIAAVTLFLGANDSNKPGSNQHVPLDEFEENMKKMVLALIVSNMVGSTAISLDIPQGN